VRPSKRAPTPALHQQLEERADEPQNVSARKTQELIDLLAESRATINRQADCEIARTFTNKPSTTFSKQAARAREAGQEEGPSCYL
jgi:hypothetical protein